MDYKKLSYDLLSNIKKDYKKFEKLFSIPGVSRGRKLSYAIPCEKAITKMILELLKNRDYKYDMDQIFNKRFDKNIDENLIKNNKWQPDLIIRDSNDKVVAVIEIKYQIGYWDYEKDLKRLKDYEKYNIIFVNFLIGNHSKKVSDVIEKYNDKIEFYVLYNKNVSYKNISVSNQYDIFEDKKHGFVSFVERIKKF